jgi:hypothetical protein
MSWIFFVCVALPCDGPVSHLTDSPECPNDSYFLKLILNCSWPEGLSVRRRTILVSQNNFVDLIVTQTAKNLPNLYEALRLLIVFATTF